MEKVTMAGAINRALRDAMAVDSSVVVFGEDVGALGGVFRVTDGLAAEFGSERCFDTPLAESGIVGMAVGMAMNGFRPVVEMQFDAFAYPAFEQIVSHVAKMRNRTAGAVTLPIVLRIPYGGGIGGVEHHCDSSEAYYAHTPGLEVYAPSSAADAYELMRAALRRSDPVVFLEPKKLYWTSEEVAFSSLSSSSLSSPSAAALSSSPSAAAVASSPLAGASVAGAAVAASPLAGASVAGAAVAGASVAGAEPGRAVVRRAGTDVTLIAYGPSVGVCLSAASVAFLEGRSLEVVDMRTLVPFDDETVCASVARTGRAVVVAEAAGFGGVAAEIAARVSERCFTALAAPVRRVTGFDIPYPPPAYESFHLPSVDRVLDAVDDLQWEDA
ncbi:alpha-ketoacid dehydrogenase subunit beta [Cryptosporangium phraense]|uniref:3-methyl-2-oxobutanoate dehydrogenase (2-methylpropanoyl-transferring) n=1 Tax=Cryptosporangium phraense TaxID=2593070 RepID=A0A545ANR8_9ACTN|nr:transketolase C-terminal domain-containing protein [Cryptosporangium phraense]TQS42920.1 alpha-ketoacid dehydrogenase subunit beta [Cryptosporangium phraense]